MAYRCVLRQCSNFKGRPNEDNRGFRCHKFPKDPKQFKLWEDWVIEKHVGTTKISKVSGLCSAHFSEDSYRPHTSRLKDDAVPSIAPPLTADIAFKLGMISRREDFNQFASAGNETASSSTSVGAVSTQVPNIVREGSTEEDVSPMGVDELCVETLSVRDEQCQMFQINRRKRRQVDAHQEDSLPDCAQNKQKCSTSLADEGEGELPLEDTPEGSDTSGDSCSSSDSEVDPADISPTATSATDESTPQVVRVRKRRRIAFLGDITPSKLSSPRSTQKVLEVVQRANAKSQKERKSLNQKLRRASNKIKDLKSLLKHLRDKNKIPLELGKLLEEKCSASSAEVLKLLIEGQRPKEYKPALREFALTLNFHSPAAYNYVRRKLLGNCLPHPRTLHKWYSAVGVTEGFTEEAKAAIKCQADMMKAQGHKLILALSHDEMSIRQQTMYTNDGVVSGFTGDGSSDINDASRTAKHARTIMAVAVNASWKIPIGYFLIDSLDARARSNILKRCLEFLHDTGAEVHSVTFDGTRTNICTVEALGANLQPGRAWKPYFLHPVTNEPVYVILDAAHMVKLWRNVFGSNVQLQDAQGRCISFDFVKKLHDVQEREGLRAGNKVTKRHVEFEREKMKVYLATQILSDSVADAIEACRDEWGMQKFVGSEGTVHFIRMANVVFDILNSTSLRGGNPFKRALSPTNISVVKEKIVEAQEYIKGLKAKGPKDVVYSPILDTRWNTGFLGFLVDLWSVEQLYEKLVVGSTLKYLPTYKLGQDHLEMIFGSVRSRGGFNNPSASHFMAAYRRLLVHTQLKEGKSGGNCWPLENVAILHVTPKTPVATQMEEADQDLIQRTDHSYARALSAQAVALSAFAVDVVEYIAGFVVKKVSVQHGCDECSPVLFRPATTGLLKRKDRGGLTSPSADVLKICRKAESLIRASARDRSFLTTKRDVHVVRIFREVTGDHPHLFKDLDDHVSTQAPLENHKFSLVKLIITKFVVVRMCHDVKRLNNSLIKDRIRTRNSKTMLFQHQ